MNINKKKVLSKSFIRKIKQVLILRKNEFFNASFIIGFTCHSCLLSSTSTLYYTTTVGSK
jgi:hypothetical protein